MENFKNSLNWFEIPVLDFNRARKFYSELYDYEMPTQEVAGYMMGFLPSDMEKGVGGAIVEGQDYVPSTTGTLVYLNGGEDLDTVLARVEKAGGRVLVPKSPISPEYGFFALFTDTEGNKLGLHSAQ